MFGNHYDGWTRSRMNGIKKYIRPEFFKSKTLLELGSGHGHVGNEFSKFGAIVTCSDARKEYMSTIAERYPHLKTCVIDCDKDDIPKTYDIILHWGVLYHLGSIEKHLKDVANKCNVLLLETEVFDSLDDTFYLQTKENGYDQAFNSKGIRPSPGYVEKILRKNGFQFMMIKDSVLNHSFHSYDWHPRETNSWKHGQRRFWICWKHVESPLVIQKPIGKRIALLIFGRIDNHTQSRDALFSSIGREHVIDVFMASDNPNHELLDKFIKTYNPVSYIADRIVHNCDLSKYPSRYGSYRDETSVIRHFINKKRVFSLLEDHVAATNSSYDVVFATRIDLLFDTSILFPDISKNTVYIPSEQDHTGINDRLAYGDYETMRTYMYIFDNIIPILESGVCDVHPEALTLENIKKYNIQVERFGYDTTIVR